MRYLILAVLVLTGCGTTRDTTTREVEQTTVSTPQPVTITSPFGDFVIQPTQVVTRRERQAVETSQTTLDLPQIAPLLQAAASATPWGGIISAVIGFGTAAFAAKKAVTAYRQRDEVIAGNERSKDDMQQIKVGSDPITGKPLSAWDILTTHLEAEQSKDTIAVVAKKTE